MCFPALLPVSKNLETFAVYRRHVRHIIGSIIGWQGQEHIEIVEAIWHTREFQLYFLENVYFKILLKNCVPVFIGQNSIKTIHIESFHYSSLNWVRSDKIDVYKLTKY